MLHKSQSQQIIIFFFTFFQPEGHFFPPLTPLWHIPMRKSRHHKAAIGEMETLLPGTVFMFFVGEFDKGSQRFLQVFLHVGACSPFCECRDIRNIAFKSGESSGNLNQDGGAVVSRLRQAKCEEGRKRQRTQERFRCSRCSVLLHLPLECGISEHPLRSSNLLQENTEHSRVR